MKVASSAVPTRQLGQRDDPNCCIPAGSTCLSSDTAGLPTWHIAKLFFFLNTNKCFQDFLSHKPSQFIARRPYILRKTYFTQTGSTRSLQEVKTRCLFNIIDFLIFSSANTVSHWNNVASLRVTSSDQKDCKVGPRNTISDITVLLGSNTGKTAPEVFIQFFLS